MSKMTLYQKAKTGKIKVWAGQVVAQGDSGYPEIHYEWGLLDGKKQLTIDVISKGVNEGKVNETTPLQQANLELERKIVKKKKEGYSEELESVHQEHSIDFSQPLPKELCFYKPKNSIDEKKIKALEKNKQAVYTVKRNGMMHIIRTSDALGTEIYSRRMDVVTANYPHLVNAFDKLPKGTILLGEMILLDGTGRDSLNKASKVCRCDAEKSIERQEKWGKAIYYIFDVAFYKEECLLTSMPFKDRLEKIKELTALCNSEYVEPIEVVDKSHAEALKEMEERSMEGLVVWDRDGVMSNDTAFTFNGKPYRPNMLWKSKPTYEDDFIVRYDPENGVGLVGKGKNYGKLGSVYCYQLDEEGNEVFLGKCGGGLSDELREFYTNASYPRVWRIEYDSAQPGTGALQFPRFSADRTELGDKEMHECLLSEQIKLAKEQELEDE